jgi:hypothetical protein
MFKQILIFICIPLLALASGVLLPNFKAHYTSLRMVREAKDEAVVIEIEESIMKIKGKIDGVMDRIKTELSTYTNMLEGDWIETWVDIFSGEIAPIIDIIETKLADYKNILTGFNQEAKDAIVDLNVATSGNRNIVALIKKVDGFISKFENMMDNIRRILNKKTMVRNPVIAGEIEHFKDKIDEILEAEDLEWVTYNQLYSIIDLLNELLD